MPDQPHKINWTPIADQLPPLTEVLASTKSAVYILRYHPGNQLIKNSANWRDRFGKVLDIQFEDVIAWAPLPAPFDPTQN